MTAGRSSLASAGLGAAGGELQIVTFVAEGGGHQPMDARVIVDHENAIGRALGGRSTDFRRGQRKRHGLRWSAGGQLDGEAEPLPGSLSAETLPPSIWQIVSSTPGPSRCPRNGARSNYPPG